MFLFTLLPRCLTVTFVRSYDAAESQTLWIWRLSRSIAIPEDNMTTYRLGVLTGDGIGPEIVEATLRVLDAVQRRDSSLRFEWIPLPMGWEAIRKTGSAMPESTVEVLAKCDGWIMGPHDSASYPAPEQEKRNPSGELRHHFDLYANLRPARATRACLRCRPRWTWSWCGRIPRGSTRTATWRGAPASSCPHRTWH